MRLGWTKGKHVLTSVPIAVKKILFKKKKIYNIQHGHQQQRQDILTWFSFCYIELWSFKLAEFLYQKEGFIDLDFICWWRMSLMKYFLKIYTHIYEFDSKFMYSQINRGLPQRCYLRLRLTQSLFWPWISLENYDYGI